MTLPFLYRLPRLGRQGPSPATVCSAHDLDRIDSSIAGDSINSRWRLPRSLTGLGSSAIVEPGLGVEELSCADAATRESATMLTDCIRRDC
jgi:hypothetical protein